MPSSRLSLLTVGGSPAKRDTTGSGSGLRYADGADVHLPRSTNLSQPWGYVDIHPQHQNTMAFNRLLINALVEMMFELASEREIYITDIITEASTEQGEKLCKILGLRKLMDTNLDTKLYIASLLPPSLRLNSLFGHKLIKFYQSKYDDMKELF